MSLGARGSADTVRVSERTYRSQQHSYSREFNVSYLVGRSVNIDGGKDIANPEPVSIVVNCATYGERKVRAHMPLC